MVSKIRRMLELLGNQIVLVSHWAFVGVALGQSALVVRFCIHYTFSVLPSSHDTHSSSPSTGRTS